MGKLDSRFSGGSSGGSIITGSGTANQVAYFSNANTVTSSAGLTYDAPSGTLQVGQHLGVEAGPSTDATARIRGTGNAGANQWGLIVDTIHSSSATSSGYNVTSQVQTAAAAFTMGIGAAFQVQGATKGAGSTITRLVNYLGATQTEGTNNAFISDNNTFTGNWFIHSSGATPVHLSSYIEIEANADPGAPTDAVRMGSKVTTDSGTPNSFAFRSEQTVSVVGVTVPTHIVRVWWNNVEYYMFLATV